MMPHIRRHRPLPRVLVARIVVAASLLGVVLGTPAESLARGGGHGSGSAGGHAGGGKAHLSSKAANPQPGAEQESGDTKGSGKSKPVNASAKPDTATAATTRPPGRKKR